MARYTALKPFAIIGANGSTVFMEGQDVPEAVAKMYPEHIRGLAKKEAPVAHNPNLKDKLTKKEIAKMDEVSLRQWIIQFHPGEKVDADAKKEDLVEIVTNLNG